MRFSAIIAFLLTAGFVSAQQQAIDELLSNVPLCVTQYCFRLGAITQRCGALLGLSGMPNLECYCSGRDRFDLTYLWYGLRDCARKSCGQGDEAEVTTWGFNLCETYRLSGLTITGSQQTTTFAVSTRSSSTAVTTSESSSTSQQAAVTTTVTESAPTESPTATSESPKSARETVTAFVLPSTTGTEPNSRGAKVGIGAGVSIAGLLLLVILLAWLRRRRNAKKKQNLPLPAHHTGRSNGSGEPLGEMDGAGALLLNTSTVGHPSTAKQEMEGSSPVSAVATPAISEKKIEAGPTQEMDAGHHGLARPESFELPAAAVTRPLELTPVKLAAPGQVLEMDGSPVPESCRAHRVPSIDDFAAIPQPRVKNEGVGRFKPCDW